MTNSGVRIQISNWHFIESLSGDKGTTLKILIDNRTTDMIKRHSGELKFKIGLLQIREASISLEGEGRWKAIVKNSLIDKNFYSQKEDNRATTAKVSPTSSSTRSNVARKLMMKIHVRNVDRPAVTDDIKSLLPKRTTKDTGRIKLHLNFITPLKCYTTELCNKISNRNKGLTPRIQPSNKPACLIALKCARSAMTKTAVKTQQAYARLRRLSLTSAGSLNTHAPPDYNVGS